MTHVFEVSIPEDKYAKKIAVRTMSLADMAALNDSTISADKESQPFWKLALFGSTALTPSGCLRHDANVIEVTGIEIDIDGLMTFDEVKDRLDALGLFYMAHTTASHMQPGKGPRVRVLLPFKKSRKPGERAPSVSRINGVLGGVVAKESWVLSTAYKYGSIVGQPPSETYLSPGEEYVDERDDLDVGALGFQAPAGQARAAGPGGRPDFESMDIGELGDEILTGVYGWEPSKHFIRLYEEQGKTEQETIDDLSALFDAVPVANRRPKKWSQHRSSITNWVKKIFDNAKKRKSKPLSALVHHLEEGARYKNSVRYNMFARRIEVSETFPPSPAQATPITFRALSDPGDILETLIDVQANGFSKSTKPQVFDALFVAGSRHAVHPPREYLNGLKWDDVPRIDKLFRTYIPAQVPEDPKRAERFGSYLDRIGACFLIGGVARIYTPGCKLDNIVVLISPQGRNKSKALAAFCPDPGWFTDDVPAGISDKDAKLALDGKWIIELAELPHLRKEVDKVKAFLSRATDRYRPPYARLVADWLRQCVFIGTTNELELPDYTGNRRFWPVPVDGLVKDELIARDRDQLWAEAVHRYRQGEKWWLSAEVEAIAAEVQNNYVESDVKDESILEWIDKESEPGKERFTVRQVLEEALGYVIDPKDRLGDSTRPIATAADQNRIQRRLRRLGYVAEPHQTRLGGERFRFWVPIGSRS